MISIIQKVKEAKVYRITNTSETELKESNNELKDSNTELKEKIAEIKKGLVIYVGIKKTDEKEMIPTFVKKILKMKYFENRTKNVAESNSEVLILSNFTIYGNISGNKFNFNKNMKCEEAREYFEEVIKEFKKQYNGENVKNGIFQTYLNIECIIDGPGNYIIEI